MFVVADRKEDDDGVKLPLETGFQEADEDDNDDDSDYDGGDEEEDNFVDLDGGVKKHHDAVRKFDRFVENLTGL